MDGVPLSLQGPGAPKVSAEILQAGTLQLATVGPPAFVKVHEGASLNVAVTLLGVPSAFILIPVKVEGEVKGAIILSEPPPGNTSPDKIRTPDTGAVVCDTVTLTVK